MTHKEAASPPLIPGALRASGPGDAPRKGYGAAPPASRLLRIACGDGPLRGRP